MCLCVVVCCGVCLCVASVCLCEPPLLLHGLLGNSLRHLSGPELHFPSLSPPSGANDISTGILALFRLQKSVISTFIPLSLIPPSSLSDCVAWTHHLSCLSALPFCLSACVCLTLWRSVSLYHSSLLCLNPWFTLFLSLLISIPRSCEALFLAFHLTDPARFCPGYLCWYARR